MAKVWGKVIGTGLGFAFGGGPFGAAIGLMVGHAYDTRKEFSATGAWETQGVSPGSFTGASQNTFITGIAVLSAKLAKTDGKVTREEIDAFKKVFRITPSEETRIGRLFDNARKSPDGFEPYAFQLAQAFSTHPTVLDQILGGLFKIAAADANPIAPAEARFLKKVAYIFHYSPENFKRIAAQTGVIMPDNENIREHERDSANSNAPFAVLGIRETATNDEIKSTYRNLIRLHHPDKLVAEGKSPEFVATANEKMKRINAAYDAISKTRGIK